MLPPSTPAYPIRNDSMAQFDIEPDPAPDHLPPEPHYEFFMIDEPTYENYAYNFLETVEDNLKLYTKCEQLDARLARVLYHACGRPDTNHLKAFIQGGYIRNCPVTPADVDRALKIYGPDVATLKGKSTRPHPPRVRVDAITTQIPRALRAKISPLTLYLDVLSLMVCLCLPALIIVSNIVRLRPWLVVIRTQCTKLLMSYFEHTTVRVSLSLASSLTMSSNTSSNHLRINGASV